MLKVKEKNQYRPFFLQTCAHFSELPSDINYMVLRNIIIFVQERDVTKMIFIYNFGVRKCRLCKLKNYCGAIGQAFFPFPVCLSVCLFVSCDNYFCLSALLSLNLIALV